ncbi:hypothetical protein NDU88_002049 [Pleurodeles waltl]|uniref:Uncharacterized protein n=1 Tax=Pleurodeles waltl TaxID=8319 RepID=A0AAV7M2V0_PLEWA|nr:hypothetical protein NDU88_002049 [Pleurodeles waltl]
MLCDDASGPIEWYPGDAIESPEVPMAVGEADIQVKGTESGADGTFRQEEGRREDNGIDASDETPEARGARSRHPEMPPLEPLLCYVARNLRGVVKVRKYV